MAAASAVDSTTADRSMGTILPDPTQLRVVRLETTEHGITAVVQTRASAVPCPICEHLARRVHSHYTRAVTDVPWHAVSFRLQLHVRRFFCDCPGCPDCPRHIFTERLPGVVAPYARRTQRLAAWVRAVGFALGGNAGMRLLSALGLGPPSGWGAVPIRSCARCAARRCRPPRTAKWSVSTTGVCDGDGPTGQSWWIWSVARSLTCSPTGRPTPSRHG